jgi:hypothetical protein
MYSANYFGGEIQTVNTIMQEYGKTVPVSTHYTMKKYEGRILRNVTHLDH